MSLILVGDNSWVPILRKLTSTELFINAELYSHHSILFSSIVEKHSEFHNSLKCLPGSQGICIQVENFIFMYFCEFFADSMILFL